MIGAGQVVYCGFIRAFFGVNIFLLLLEMRLMKMVTEPKQKSCCGVILLCGLVTTSNPFQGAHSNSIHY